MVVRSQWIAMVLLVGSAQATTNTTIVVSAPRLDDLDLMAVNVAADVTEIDRATIESSGAASVPELLRKEANILVRSNTGTGNDGAISMRGFGENSHLRTLVLVDGHKMNRPDMGVMGWMEIPPSSIERVEVIRGGQNVLYGAHAVGGVVRITTKRGADAGLQLGGAFGSFGYLSGNVGYGGAVGDIDYYAGLNSFTSDGFRTNSQSRATTASGSLGWFMNDADTLTLRASVGDSHQQYPGALSYDGMQQDPTQSKNTGDEHSDVVSGLATLIWESDRDWGKARITSGANLRDMDWELSQTKANNRMVGVSLAPRIKYGADDHFLMGGVDGFYDALDFENYLYDYPDYVQAYAELDRLTVAPYLFAQRTFKQDFVLNGGARYEYARTDNNYVDYVDDQILPTEDLLGIGTFPNPNYKNPPDADPDKSYSGVIEKQGWAAEVSLAYNLSRESSVWVGYDRVYRYPTLDEAASYQGYPLSDPLNENLDPETGNNFELGGRFKNRNWMGSLTAFYMTLDDEIAFLELPPIPPATDPFRLNVNLDSTRRIGIEPELGYDGSWYGASTRWTFVDARFTSGENEGNRVPLVPWGYGVISGWVDPIDYIRFVADLSYVAEQYVGGDIKNERRKMDPYALLDLRAIIQMSASATLQLGIYNLADTVYASSAYYKGFYPGAGRSFRIGLNLEF